MTHKYIPKNRLSVIKLRATGVSMNAIAAHIGVDPKTLIRHYSDDLILGDSLLDHFSTTAIEKAHHIRSLRMKLATPDNSEALAIKRFHNACPKDYHVDHIIPIAKGGLNVMLNLQYLPGVDNCRKHAKITAQAVTLVSKYGSKVWR